ncbi:hypothetical protein BDN72DRAFT_905855 [Pluteus cervinus]|uniref:Uncharacterized protein n=1 Tax=Pluteus cervinus TaxID=181527 RepID=A0ACD3A0P9_9AGAR|nr:hypothetical protein BDN72DRAFT_905855 [Pluteus cervinus]
MARSRSPRPRSPRPRSPRPRSPRPRSPRPRSSAVSNDAVHDSSDDSDRGATPSPPARRVAPILVTARPVAPTLVNDDSFPFTEEHKASMERSVPRYFTYCDSLHGEGPRKLGGVYGLKGKWVMDEVFPSFLSEFFPKDPNGRPVIDAPSFKVLAKAMKAWFNNRQTRRRNKPSTRAQSTPNNAILTAFKGPTNTTAKKEFVLAHRDEINAVVQDKRLKSKLTTQSNLPLRQETITQMSDGVDLTEYEELAAKKNKKRSERPSSDEIYENQDRLPDTLQAVFDTLCGWNQGQFGEVGFFVVATARKGDGTYNTFNITSCTGSHTGYKAPPEVYKPFRNNVITWMQTALDSNPGPPTQPTDDENAGAFAASSSKSPQAAPGATPPSSDDEDAGEFATPSSKSPQANMEGFGASSSSEPLRADSLGLFDKTAGGTTIINSIAYPRPRRRGPPVVTSDSEVSDQGMSPATTPTPPTPRAPTPTSGDATTILNTTTTSGPPSPPPSALVTATTTIFDTMAVTTPIADLAVVPPAPGATTTAIGDSVPLISVDVTPTTPKKRKRVASKKREKGASKVPRLDESAPLLAGTTTAVDAPATEEIPADGQCASARFKGHGYKHKVVQKYGKRYVPYEFCNAFLLSDLVLLPYQLDINFAFGYVAPNTLLFLPA